MGLPLTMGCNPTMDDWMCSPQLQGATSNSSAEGMASVREKSSPWGDQGWVGERVIAARDNQLDLAPGTKSVVDCEGLEFNQVRQLGVNGVIFEYAAGHQLGIVLRKLLLDLDEVIRIRLLRGNVELDDGIPDDQEVSR